jgi:hypothetical protein
MALSPGLGFGYGSIFGFFLQLFLQCSNMLIDSILLKTFKFETLFNHNPFPYSTCKFLSFLGLEIVYLGIQWKPSLIMFFVC